MIFRPALAAAALVLFAAGDATAHSKTDAHTPADGATVAEAPLIAMDFDAPMRVIAIELTREGDAVELERATGMEPVTRFEAAPAEGLGPGAYRVDWRGMSADGHPMQGEFGFTIAE
ncbi:copper resistance protein CopC [Jannaschia sp. KMU-145]|uniref:copper resistance CopC family protein n=1 Tax=Jannaschia halovivens TaxID=3388667 RepID=UPI00396B26F0